MRGSRELVLLVFVLLAVRSPVVTARAEDRLMDDLSGAASTWTVEGYGESEEDAFDVAQKKALESIKNDLDERFGASFWVLDVDTLHDRGVLGDPTLLPSRRKLPGNRPVYHAQVRVTLTPAFLADMNDRGRSLRMGDRHLLVGRVLLGLVTLLLVVIGYLRLEDVTRGYYTRLLRLGAIAILALVGAGLWLL